MQRLILALCLILFLLGCNQEVSETPEAVVEEVMTPTATPSPTSTSTPFPSATPRPATPIPSPTVTPTPTPVIYTVQSGDTLLSIAIEFDVSTEAIQTTNGIVDPRLLQIGQELLIPPPDTSEVVAPTVTPTPLPLTVEAIYFLETEQGTLWGLGEVSNPGDAPVSEVVVEAALLNETGVVLAREAAYTQLDIIPPGETVPFAILFENPPSSFAQYQVIPVTGLPISSETRYYFDLEIFDSQGNPTGLNGYQVEGQLKNTGESDTEAIRLVAVVYDEEGRVLAQRQAELEVELLKAGAIAPFVVDLIVPEGVVMDYKLVVQGLKVE